MNKNKRFITFKHLLMLIKEDNYINIITLNLGDHYQRTRVLPVLFVTTLY